jgi:hypothetical protein
MTAQHRLTLANYVDGYLATVAAEHGGNFLDVHLDKGRRRHQPTIVLTGGRAVADELGKRLQVFRLRTLVPVDEHGRDFEHHIELRGEPERATAMIRLAETVDAHGAGLCRDPRRLIVQRCLGASRDEAAQRLERLLADLRADGHEFVSVQRWIIKRDTAPEWDEGWLSPARPEKRWVVSETMVRPGLPDFPPTFQPVPDFGGVEQRFVFDPALKQFSNAYRAGEPVFADPVTGHRWHAARADATGRLLTAIGGSRWVNHLVLRGSSVMSVWVGEGARTPGDLDFVVVPQRIRSDSGDARELLDGIRAAASAAGMRSEDTSESAIWTYERADGRRLVIPFSTAGAPDGHVQIDVVFGEHLPMEPEVVILPGVSEPLLAAPAGLSLAWKLLWLATDGYPQGKDLYDAVLLAEHAEVDLGLVRRLLEPELGAEAASFSAASTLSWNYIDWDNFLAEHPSVTGTAESWLRRLALALDRAWDDRH